MVKKVFKLTIFVVFFTVIVLLFVSILFFSSFIPYQVNKIKEINNKPFETEFMQVFLCEWMQKPTETEITQYKDGNVYFCEFSTEDVVDKEFLQNVANSFLIRHKKDFAVGYYKFGDLFYPDSIYFINEPKVSDFIQENNQEISFCVYYTNVVVNSFSLANLEEGFHHRALNLRRFKVSFNNHPNDDGLYVIKYCFEMVDASRKGFYADGDFFTQENKNKWIIKY